MEIEVINFIIPIVTSSISGIVTFLVSKSKSKSEIEKIKIYYNSEIDKVKLQQSHDIERLKEQQQSEIEKIKEQSRQEIEKLTIEIDKQAELYEKNMKTDMIGSFMGEMIKGNTQGFENLMNIAQQIDKYKIGKK